LTIPQTILTINVMQATETVEAVLNRVYENMKGIRVPIYFEVRPRYTCGSPGQVSERICAEEALSEQEGYQRALSGVYGEESKAKAEREGLEGICFVRWSKGNKTWRYDLIMNVKYEEPKRLETEDEDRLKLLRHWKEFGLSNWHTQLEAELVALENRAKIHRQAIK